MKTKIRLQTSWLLNERFKLNTDDLQEKFDAVNSVFIEREEKIVEGLEKVTGLHFLRNYIDVFLINLDDAPSISHPTIVKIYDNVNKTVRVIIHELIHNLMWDNEEQFNWSLKIQELFKTEEKSIAIHIAVHAILEAFYKDILNNEDAIMKDIQESQDRPVYRRAWEIVKEQGYKNILDKLKKSG